MVTISVIHKRCFLIYISAFLISVDYNGHEDIYIYIYVKHLVFQFISTQNLGLQEEKHNHLTRTPTDAMRDDWRDVLLYRRNSRKQEIESLRFSLTGSPLPCRHKDVGLEKLPRTNVFMSSRPELYYFLRQISLGPQLLPFSYSLYLFLCFLFFVKNYLEVFINFLVLLLMRGEKAERTHHSIRLI